MAVTIAPGEALEPGVPQTLFQTNLLPSDYSSEYAVSADGRRFLFLETISRRDEETLGVLLRLAAPSSNALITADWRCGCPASLLVTH